MSGWTAGPSGSRWEPAPDGTVPTGPAFAPPVPPGPYVAVAEPRDDRERDERRRRRWPLVALLVTLLTLGAGAGGIVVVRALTDPAPASGSPAGVSGGERGQDPTAPDGRPGEGHGFHHGPRPDGGGPQGGEPGSGRAGSGDGTGGATSGDGASS